MASAASRVRSTLNACMIYLYSPWTWKRSNPAAPDCLPPAASIGIGGTVGHLVAKSIRITALPQMVGCCCRCHAGLLHTPA